MIAVVQRVKEARVNIEGKTKSEIKNGLLVLLGIGHEDSDEDFEWLSAKIIQLRIFSDAEGKMNLSLQDVGGDLLIVSQFTLYASTKKGNRPSYIDSAKPEVAIPMYEKFIQQCTSILGKEVYTGTFGADMQVDLVNDGPVTIIIDTKNKR